MKRVMYGFAALAFAALICGGAGFARHAEAAPPVEAAKFDQILNAENQGRGAQVAGPIDDLAFLRRVTIDLLGRIPTEQEARAYLAIPAAERRSATIDRLLADERFADRWTVFLADMLRIRANADGGAQFLAFVHQALERGMPYDELSRRLIIASGKPSLTPEVGFILGDGADPMALAGTTSQVFLGIRIACAQCHDHPFDVWTREQFYGFAAYFGKTRRVESQLTNVVYATEAAQSTVMWPPLDVLDATDRKPMDPKFPFNTIGEEEKPQFIARLLAARAAAERERNRPKETSVDDLLGEADSKVAKAIRPGEEDLFDVAGEARRERSKIDTKADLYKASVLRNDLASLITNPRNRYFSQCLTNRVWADMVGHGFVEPVDDFNDQNPPSHPNALNFLSEEFVAQGYDLRKLLRIICNTEAYQRGRLNGIDESVREEAEAAFTSAPMRRMLAESLFDSIVQAGHLFEQKYPAGANLKTVRQLVRVALPREGEVGKLAGIGGGDKPGMGKPQVMKVESAYDLESAIEIDFTEALAADDEVDLDKMAVMSKEEVEAMQMTRETGNNPRMRYVERYQDVQVDDNPKFASAMRMASPADPAHFVRIFGQPARVDLGDHRDHTPSMRQALMMLNGKLTHEAARVGEYEPVFALIDGDKPQVEKAVKLVYMEILTREPSAEELADAASVVKEGESVREGMADLRWVLFNSHEFRFLP